MHSASKLSVLILACTVLGSCTTTDESFRVQASKVAAGDAYQETKADELTELDVDSEKREAGLEQLPSLSGILTSKSSQKNTAMQFSDTNELRLAAEQMPAREFIHTVFGELLKVSYVVAEGIPSIEDPVTLNLQETVSSRELFMLAAKILDGKNITVTKNEGVFFVHPKDGSAKGEVSIGVGRTKSTVPQAAGTILQMVPLRYGMNVSLERTLGELTSLLVTPDFQKNVLFLRGERAEIFRGLDLIELMDVPASRGRFVSILRLTYISPESYVDRAADLLLAEGITADKGKAGQSNLAMVPLEQIGAVALFGSDEFYVERAGFWAAQLDKPSEGGEKRYYIFHPRYARAADLGASIAGLLGQSAGIAGRGNSSRDTQSAGNDLLSSQPSAGASSAVRSGAATEKGPAITVQSDDLNMTVDDRSNTIVFYTTGIRYQNLLPMIKRLDVMPKQILLEATIAEVTLTDEFAMGLEFALKKGRFNFSTKGAFGVEDLGGFSLSFIDGADSVLAQLQASNNRVNVLSSPSIVVRDGVSANINVGNDIPTIGSTSINPGTETQSTTVVYRKTGVSLSVTPTINAQGLVIMQIDQTISNTVEGSTVSGSPAFFDRSLQTEVLAQSGQTIMLGGLMSENTTKTKSNVPFLSDLPLLGALFKSDKDSTTKTELVILITPKVIDQPEHWQSIRQKLDSGLQHLKLRD